MQPMMTPEKAEGSSKEEEEDRLAQAPYNTHLEVAHMAAALKGATSKSRAQKKNP